MAYIYYAAGEAKGTKDALAGKGMDPNLMALDSDERQGYVDGYNLTLKLLGV